MAIVCASVGSVETDGAAGRGVRPGAPPNCPRCGGPMVFWSGYQRDVRSAFDPDAFGAQRVVRIWVPRVRCKACGHAPGLLPWFCLTRRLDVVEVIGSVIAAVAGAVPVAAAAAMQAVPRSTARGWTTRFAQRASGIAARFAGVAIGWGSGPFDPPAHPPTAALEAIGRAFAAARRRLAGNVAGVWRFASVISGGALLATNRSPP